MVSMSRFVYIVTDCDNRTISIWTTEKKAQREANRINATNGSSLYWMKFVNKMELNNPKGGFA